VQACMRGRMDLHVYPVHQLFTHRTHDYVVGWTCMYARLVGWMDGDERLGLGPRVMDMPHEVTGEGQDDVRTKTWAPQAKTAHGGPRTKPRKAKTGKRDAET